MFLYAMFVIQVVGVIIAASCMGLTSYLGNPAFDAMGSLLVGGLLGSVALFIINTNVAALVGQSIPQENLDKINAELESDVMVMSNLYSLCFSETLQYKIP